MIVDINMIFDKEFLSKTTKYSAWPPKYCLYMVLGNVKDKDC
jgi:hypothetical protein